jgi:phospholipid/cholesterol/gamma-HCH transport system substrate-binding protein
MATRSQKVRLALFLIVSCLILLLFFAFLVGNRFLRRTAEYHIIYEGVTATGLEPGAAVKYYGIQVGRVTELSVVDPLTIRVDIQVKPGTPIKRDTEAVMASVGITGMKFIELRGGTRESELLPEGEAILPGESLFSAFTEQAQDILTRLQTLLASLNQMIGPETVETLETAMKSLSAASQETEELVRSVRDQVRPEDLRETIENARIASARMRETLDSLDVAGTAAAMRELMTNTNQLVLRSDLLVLKAREDLLASLQSLEQTLDNLHEASTVIRDNPSVLIRGRASTGDRVE